MSGGASIVRAPSRTNDAAIAEEDAAERRRKTHTRKKKTHGHLGKVIISLPFFFFLRSADSEQPIRRYLLCRFQHRKQHPNTYRCPFNDVVRFILISTGRPSNISICLVVSEQRLFVVFECHRASSDSSTFLRSCVRWQLNFPFDIYGIGRQKSNGYSGPLRRCQRRRHRSTWFWVYERPIQIDFQPLHMPFGIHLFRMWNVCVCLIAYIWLPHVTLV